MIQDQAKEECLIRVLLSGLNDLKRKTRNDLDIISNDIDRAISRMFKSLELVSKADTLNKKSLLPEGGEPSFVSLRDLLDKKLAQAKAQAKAELIEQGSSMQEFGPINQTLCLLQDEAREIMTRNGGYFIGQKELELNESLPPIPTIVTKEFLEADCPIFKGDKVATNTALGYDVASKSWHLIGLKVVPDTFNKSAEDQDAILALCNKVVINGKQITASSPENYKPFRTIVEAVIKQQVNAGKNDYPFKRDLARTAGLKNAYYKAKLSDYRVLVGFSSAWGADVNDFFLSRLADDGVGLAFAWNINKQGEL